MFGVSSRTFLPHTAWTYVRSPRRRLALLHHVEGLSGLAFVIIFEHRVELGPYCLNILDNAQDVVAFERAWMYACTAHAFGKAGFLVDNADGQSILDESDCRYKPDGSCTDLRSVSESLGRNRNELTMRTSTGVEVVIWSAAKRRSAWGPNLEEESPRLIGLRPQRQTRFTNRPSDILMHGIMSKGDIDSPIHTNMCSDGVKTEGIHLTPSSAYVKGAMKDRRTSGDISERR